MGLALGGAIVGYAEGKGLLKKLPAIGGSPALTVALAGYAVTRFIRNPTARMAGMAAVVAGAFDFGKTHAGGVSGFDGSGGGGPGSGF
jgi:hypothetical protein